MQVSMHCVIAIFEWMYRKSQSVFESTTLGDTNCAVAGRDQHSAVNDKIPLISEVTHQWVSGKLLSLRAIPSCELLSVLQSHQE